MSNYQSVLETISKKGKDKEAFYFDCANQEANKHTKELILSMAHEYSKMRHSLIDEVKQGRYAEYGITADDIVE